MTYDRRIVRYGAAPWDLGNTIEASAISGCWFELNRQGGCGSGRLKLREGFLDRNVVEAGDWIALEYGEGDRWYLGRVEERSARSPVGVTLELEGLSKELGEVFPGGFGAEGKQPHVYRATDLFSEDPDYSQETYDSVARAEDVVRLMLHQLVDEGQLNIRVVPERIETRLDTAADVVTMKFRGEESMRSILKDLALRCGGVSWGVDEQGEFFWQTLRTNEQQRFREGDDVLSLEEKISRQSVINRVLLTGDYIYGVSGDPRSAYRWRGNYIQPQSISKYGEKRIRIWAPWIRTEQDSLALVTEFFRTYAQPRPNYHVVVASDQLIKPWEGRVALLDRNGNELIVSSLETVRVEFDHLPRLTMDLGIEDPRELWPEPGQDERWEISKNRRNQGGRVSFSESEQTSNVSDVTSELTSDELTSDDVTSSAAGSSDIGSSGEGSSGDGSGGGGTSDGGSSDDGTSDGGSGGGFPTWWTWGTHWTWDSAWTSDVMTSDELTSEELTSE